MRRLAFFLSIAVLLCLPGSLLAQRMRAPVMVRITGYAAPKADGTAAVARWKVIVKGERTPFTAVKLNVLSGGFAYYQLVNALEPYPIAFTIYGEDDALKQITASTSEAPVLIIGALSLGRGARTLQVSSVEAAGGDAAGSAGAAKDAAKSAGGDKAVPAAP